MSAFAAVDWGLTRLRVWLVRADGAISGEKRGEDGLLAISPERFAETLETYLDELGAAHDLPVLICGSAGSRQGWAETAYLKLPADLNRLPAESRVISSGRRSVAILPGVAAQSSDEPDIMRGEETQLLGAALEAHGEGRYCLPGTHSRWVTMSGMTIRNFRTFMTGELFALLCLSSILRHSLDDATPIEANDPAFLTGVRDGWSNAGRLTHFLFSVRAGNLLHGRPAKDNRARLSGLLIGAEMAGAGITGGETVALVASDELGPIYHAALAVCGCQVRSIDADIAVQRGLFETWRKLEATMAPRS